MLTGRIAQSETGTATRLPSTAKIVKPSKALNIEKILSDVITGESSRLHRVVGYEHFINWFATAENLDEKIGRHIATKKPNRPDLKLKQTSGKPCQLCS